MAVLFGFYDSLAGDRVYNAETFSIPISHIIAPGVFANYGDLYAVSPADGTLQVIVGSGASWWNETWTRNDDDLTLDVAAADSALPRIDRVILRHDRRPSIRANTFMVLKGTPASVPAPPPLSTDVGVSDMVIAEVRVAANATTLTTGAIVSKVGTATTPYVTAPLSSVNIEPIVAQLTESFNDWFDNIQGLLAGDAAANLALKVEDLQDADADFDKQLADLTKKVGKTETDTGWVAVPVLSGWKSSGEFSARVIGNKLYFAGLFSRTTKTTTSISVGLQIAAWPDAIKNALVAAGWPAAYRVMGNTNSTLGTYGMLAASNAGLWIQYRNRNPGVGEWMSGAVQGAVL